jgi:hypothetical protein
MRETATFRTQTAKGLSSLVNDQIRRRSAEHNAGIAFRAALHPRNVSSTLNQSRSAKPAGTITSSPSPADFRTPTSARSNLHSVQQAGLPNLTRVPSLEAFGRRPRCTPHRPDRPSSETLHKVRRTQYEHMFSALPSNSDIARRSRHVSNVPWHEIAAR